MSQLTFKIPHGEKEFLEWWANKTGQPKSSIYRNATLEAFVEWKIEILLKEYQQGIIGFKKMCNLGGLTFNQGSLIIQERNIEPPISELIDEHTKSVRERIKPEDLYKDGKKPKRKSLEVITKEEKE
ncbi:MAG: hypothetical protein HeimC3_32600 [Candidatus Heimdallarchaeota archaeon LC_3]|nr:MAG: hypothetical protein HeimC3_32600 [Candidatus Heimdallarchaeota archaeon LC_3]